MGKVKEIFALLSRSLLTNVNWKKLQWSMVRTLAMKFLKKSLSSLTGPIGWIVINLLPFLVDDIIKPIFLHIRRKAVKAKDRLKGKKKAKDIRDVPADNVDDIYDNMRK